MTLKQIREQIMFQTNNDVEDLGDYMPHLNDYINEGYDALVLAFRNVHVGSESNDYALLENEGDEPLLPEYAHRALADYGTYMVYRNGNAVKQNRGMAFYSAFLNVASKLKYERSSARKFINIYTD